MNLFTVQFKFSQLWSVEKLHLILIKPTEPGPIHRDSGSYKNYATTFKPKPTLNRRQVFAVT